MSAVGGLLAAALIGVVLPFVVTRGLLRSLSSTSGRAVTENYRGVPVRYGLGAAWLAWGSGALGAGGVLLGAAGGAPAGSLLAVFGALALVCCAVGLIDDAYGSRDARGFRGHLRALARGVLTTGGLKVIGIGAASLAACWVLDGVLGAWSGEGTSAIGVPVAAASVALTANLVNLSDLRPGRAHKLYLLIAVAGLALAPIGPLGRADLGIRGIPGLLSLAVLVLGPLAATWGPDVSERAMLGDAGANAMGAVAGLLIACSLPLKGLVVWTTVLLAANLASERVSFSALIERNRVLSWIDGLGRRAAPDRRVRDAGREVESASDKRTVEGREQRT